jgi:hypothetical protein
MQDRKGGCLCGASIGLRLLTIGSRCSAVLADSSRSTHDCDARPADQ